MEASPDENEPVKESEKSDEVASLAGAESEDVESDLKPDHESEEAKPDPEPDHEVSAEKDDNADKQSAVSSPEQKYRPQSGDVAEKEEESDAPSRSGSAMRMSSGALPGRMKPHFSVKLETPLSFAHKKTRGLIHQEKSKIAKNTLLASLLTTIAISYMLGGGWLFLYLEERQEVTFFENIAKFKNDTAILLATELRQVKAHEAVWAQYVFKHLDIFEESLLKSTGLGYWREGHAQDRQRWRIPSTFFYSLSLMTSSGYGSMTPRSGWGRIATVCYSFVGIPLTICWLVYTGRILAWYWSWMFDSICCHFCCPDVNATPTSNIKSKRRRSNAVAPATEAKQSQTKEVTSISPNGFLNTDNRTEDSVLVTKKQRLSKFRMVPILQVKMPNEISLDIATDSKLSDLDHAVSIVFAILFVLVYFVFGSAVVSFTSKQLITDTLYFNYLMFVSLGPGCYELKDDIEENRMKANPYYLSFLIVGYVILATVCNLIYMYWNSDARFKRTGSKNLKY